MMSAVLDFIHAEDLRLNDSFPSDVTRVYASMIDETGDLPSPQSFSERAKRIRTTFFRVNTTIRKMSFLEDLGDVFNRQTEPFLDDIRQERTRIPGPEVPHPPERVYVDDIDSFKKVKDVRPEDVSGLVPLSVSEADIKQSIADIIGERFIPKDWGGEKSDLYSTHVILRGKRTSTAFMLKGPSVRKLTIAHCGKNGDQLLRLTGEPARLFVVQSVGEIVTDVIKLLNTLASERGRERNEKLYYCIVDGVDTARVLSAYGKLHMED